MKGRLSHRPNLFACLAVLLAWALAVLGGWIGILIFNRTNCHQPDFGCVVWAVYSLAIGSAGGHLVGVVASVGLLRMRWWWPLMTAPLLALGVPLTVWSNNMLVWPVMILLVPALTAPFARPRRAIRSPLPTPAPPPPAPPPHTPQ